MDNPIPLEELLGTAIQAAEAAGRHALSNKHRRTEANETFAHDVKLVLDAECQKIAEEAILRRYPGHGILGEEDARPAAGEDEYEWIIDPIDGTMNYTHNFPYWCASVAVRRGDRVLAGCVFEPEMGRLYTAHAEGPARLNGDPIQPSETRRLEDAIIFSGLSKHMESSAEPHFEMFRRIALSTQKVRITGSAALDICHVADGSSDGYMETNIYLWDYAASGLIAERAGAVLVPYPQGNEPLATTVICTNRNLLEPLQAIYSDCIA